MPGQEVGESVIVGLGETGISVARYFLSIGHKFSVVDSREKPPSLEELLKIAPDTTLSLGEFDEKLLLKAEQIVLSPGVSKKTPSIAKAIEEGVHVIGDIDIFTNTVSKPIIGITGSNGKSTVAALVALILAKSGRSYGLGGNLDGDNFKPALDMLFEEEKDFYILELSSFQLETTQNLGAEIVTLLNLSEDHMDRYEDASEYLAAKQRIFRGCRKVLVNLDDPSSAYVGGTEVDVKDFSFNQPSPLGIGLIEDEVGPYLAYGNEKIAYLSELKIIGKHNVANAMAAAGLALSIGINLKSIREAIIDFTGLPHRCQWVCNLHGVDFYNDSKGTNVGATMAAISGLGSRVFGEVILLAGGLAKSADFVPLAPVVQQWCKTVILIGEDAKIISKSLSAETRIVFAEDMKEAVVLAQSFASTGDAVLLSPACASFDMYSNFQQRGDTFVSAVRSLH